MCRFVAITLLGLLAGSAVAQDNLAALERKARELEEKGQTDAAVKLFAQAVSGPDSPAVGDVLDRYCSMLLRTGRYGDDVPVAERLLKIRSARAGEGTVQSAGARKQLALAYKLTGRVSGAIPLYATTHSSLQ